jgi:hypothetical protein
MIYPRLFFSLSLVLLIAACKPPAQTYCSDSFCVTFPGPFEVRESDEQLPQGKVHKTAAVCTLAEGDFALLTTDYPTALVSSRSDDEVLRKELDVTLERLEAKLVSANMDTNSKIPCLQFTFEIQSEIKKHGEGRLYYQGQKSFLISALYATRTKEVAGFSGSINNPAR